MSASPAPHRRITGKLVIATHNPGKLREMRELLGALRDRRRLGRRAWPGRTGRDRRKLCGECAHQGESRDGCLRLAGLCRRFRSCRRRARRCARHPFCALGGTEQGFRARHGGDRFHAARSRRAVARATPRARVRNAFRNEDFQGLQGELHRLRASCGFVGAARLQHAVQALGEDERSHACLQDLTVAAQALTSASEPTVA